MKYDKEQRLEIGRKIYEGKLTLATAAVNYDINLYTARDYDDMSKAELAKELVKLKRDVNRALRLAKQQG